MAAAFPAGKTRPGAAATSWETYLPNSRQAGIKRLITLFDRLRQEPAGSGDQLASRRLPPDKRDFDRLHGPGHHHATQLEPILFRNALIAGLLRLPMLRSGQTPRVQGPQQR